MKYAKRLMTRSLLFLLLLLAAAEARADEFDDLRQRWFQLLTGGHDAEKDPAILKQVQSVHASAAAYWKNKFIKDTVGRKQLWADLHHKVSADITASYTRLCTMALACQMKGGPLYQSQQLKTDIIAALDWLYMHHYNEHTAKPVPGKPTAFWNFWDYQMGIPMQLNDIMVLLYDELGPDRINTYIKALDYFVPDQSDHYLKYPHVISFEGANRVWISAGIALRGVIGKNKEKISYAIKELAPVFEYVTTGDGFYKDGSFIQHRRAAYSGGYGIIMISYLPKLMYLFNGTNWQLNPQQQQTVQDWVTHTYEPIVYKGEVMSMTTGRQIARSGAQTLRARVALIPGLLLLSEIATTPFNSQLKARLKAWLTEDTTFSSPYTLLKAFDIRIARSILNDPHIQPAYGYTIYKQFANMDRAVQHRPGYAVAISMHSSRVYNYEMGNFENLKGYHTADGMTYLYNDDLKQYQGNYWATVNPYRLPGTTVEVNSTVKENRVGGDSWVGGCALDHEYGVTGMWLKPALQTLEAKKSWFLFNNEIVALGAGILNKDNQLVNTYIEQRKLSAADNETITVNDVQLKSGQQGDSGLLYRKTARVHISGATPGTSIGWYFPEPADLRVVRQQQTGRWRDISMNGDTTSVSNPFFTIWTEHGNHRSDEAAAYNKYAYVLLPGCDRKALKRYAVKPDIRVLENNAQVQAVYEMTLDIIGANFWTDSLQQLAFNGKTAYLSCTSKAAVMVKREKEGLTIAVADPTMNNKGGITIYLDETGTLVPDTDNRVVATCENNRLVLRFNVKDMYGATVVARLKK